VYVCVCVFACVCVSVSRYGLTVYVRLFCDREALA
jgi:hypothetical protein